MTGKILNIDTETNSGVISAQDGNRYNFNISEWKTNNRQPAIGLEVDFTILDEMANEIYLINQAVADFDVEHQAKGAFNHYLDAFRNYATFSGRASRSAFWYFQLFNFIMGILITVVTAVIPIFAFVSLIYSLAVIVPSFALGARRLHDTGRSGWWQLLILIPLIGIIVLIIFWVQQTKQTQTKYDLN